MTASETPRQADKLSTDINPIPVSRTRSNSGFRWLRVIVTLGLVIWLVMMVDWVEFLAVLSGARPGPVLAALLVLLATRFLTAYKWKLLLTPKKLMPTYGFLLRLVLVSGFLGTFLPTSIGGDLVRIIGLQRECRQTTIAIVSVLMDRLTGLASLLAVAMAGTCLTIGNPLGEVLIPIVLLPGATILIGLLLMFSTTGHYLSKRLTVFLSTRFRLHFPAKMDKAFRAYRHFPMLVIAALAISVLLQLCRVAVIYLILLALGVHLSMEHAMILIPPALFVGLLPISIAGIGVREGAIVLFLGLVAIPASTAMAVALISRILGLAVNLPGGAFVVSGKFQTGRPAG